MGTGGGPERRTGGSADGYQIVGRFPGVAEAALAVSALESAGIEARIRDEHTIGVNWFWTLALGGVAVEVPEGHRAEAVEVLESAGLDAEPLTGDEARAYASGVERRRWRGLWGIFLVAPWLWLLVWPVIGRAWRRDAETGEE